MGGIRIEITLKLPVETKKKERWYVASCPALDVVSQGETEEQAKLSLSEALKVFLDTCVAQGTLEAVLRECGFQPIRGEAEPPQGEDYLDIPVYLLAQHSESGQCHRA